jgi:hypothetical protein
MADDHILPVVVLPSAPDQKGFAGYSWRACSSHSGLRAFSMAGNFVEDEVLICLYSLDCPECKVVEFRVCKLFLRYDSSST